MTKTAKRFILVDDDPLNNFLSKLAIQKTLGNVEVNDFSIPELALEYIETEFKDNQMEEKTTLFLDINMPTLTGWEFLDKLDTFIESIKNQLTIYILSSTVNPSDYERATTNPLVIDIIEKPLNKTVLIKIFGSSAI